MFGLISGLYQSLHEEIEISILLVGCDGAGKTSVLERCKATDLEIKNKEHESRFGKQNSKPSSSSSSSSSSNKANQQNEPPSYNKARGDQDEERHTICPSPARYSHAFVLGDESPVEKKTNGGGKKKRKSLDKMKEIKEEVMDEHDDVEMEIDVREGAKMFPLDKILPTVGMNLAKLKAFGCKCSFWDLGGKQQMRPLWERYYPDTDAVVFVIDITSSESKILEARKALEAVKNDEKLNGVPILIFANKVDKLSFNEFINKLNMFPPEQQEMMIRSNYYSIRNGRKDERENYGIIDLDGFHLIRLCYGSAKTGAGVRDAFEWLISTAKNQIIYESHQNI